MQGTPFVQKGWQKAILFCWRDFFERMAAVYILYSEKLDSFYTGSCLAFHLRLPEHLDKVNPESYTAKADDWQVFFLAENLSYSQARAIEKHIKKMKGKVYMRDLVKYPDIMVASFAFSCFNCCFTFLWSVLVKLRKLMIAVQ